MTPILHLRARRFHALHTLVARAAAFGRRNLGPAPGTTPAPAARSLGGSAPMTAPDLSLSLRAIRPSDWPSPWGPAR